MKAMQPVANWTRIGSCITVEGRLKLPYPTNLFLRCHWSVDERPYLCVGTTNSEDAKTITSQAVAVAGGIPQGPTFIQAERSYGDVVQDNRSTHSIELIK